jgi:hypothetical protein
VRDTSNVGDRLDFTIAQHGHCRIDSPMSGVRFVQDHERVLYPSTLKELRRFLDQTPAMESAGPRERIFFDPGGLPAASSPAADRAPASTT